MNRRAKTTGFSSVKSNSIFGVVIMKDGYPQRQLNFYYQRKFQDGSIYTGPVLHTNW